MRWLVVIIVALVLVVVPSASSPPRDVGAGSDPEAAAKELEEFIPTEEITADSAVSFPVDI